MPARTLPLETAAFCSKTSAPRFKCRCSASRSPPFPTEFRVLVDRGDEAQATACACALTDNARFARDGPWLLFVADERRSGSGSVLFQSGPLSRGDAAVPFSVEEAIDRLHVDQQACLVLEAFMACDCFQGAHADWLALHFEPSE